MCVMRRFQLIACACWSERREAGVGGRVGFWGRELSPKAVRQRINNWLVGCLAGSSSEDPSEEHYAPWGDSGAQQPGLLEDWHPLWRLSGNSRQQTPTRAHMLQYMLTGRTRACKAHADLLTETHTPCDIYITVKRCMYLNSSQSFTHF